MADTLTPNLRLTNQENGGNENSWGDKADANFEQIDDVLGDTLALSGLNGGTTTLTTEQELVAIIEATGTLLANESIVFSGRGGFWIVKNGTSGNFTLTCLVSSQTGVEIPQGTTKVIYCNGTDIFFANPDIAASAEETVASASTANILGASSEFIAISGTTTITSLGTGANKKRFVRATGAFKLTHNAASLILPTGADITTVAGDTFIVISDASSNARVYAYQRVSGTPLKSGTPIGATEAYLGKSSAPVNYLFLNGESIGNASSGGTARASDSADTETLFTLLWNDYSNTELPIQDSAGTPTTRGADAATDFAANKRLPLPDIRGRVIAGLGTMGGTSSANRLTDQSGGVNGDTMGDAGGAETHTLVESELADHDHGPGTLTDSFFPTASGATMITARGGSTTSVAQTGSGSPNYYPSSQMNSADQITLSLSGLTTGAGSDGAHNNVQPTIILTWIVYAGVA